MVKISKQDIDTDMDIHVRYQHRGVCGKDLPTTWGNARKIQVHMSRIPALIDTYTCTECTSIEESLLCGKDLPTTWEHAIRIVLEKDPYGVATVSRIDKIIGLFCRVSSLLLGSFAKETYNLFDPTNQSHPILHIDMHVYTCIYPKRERNRMRAKRETNIRIYIWYGNGPQ